MNYYQLKGFFFSKGAYSVKQMSTPQAETTHGIFSHSKMLYNHWSNMILSIDERVWSFKVKVIDSPLF